MMLHAAAPITGTNMHQNMHQPTQRTEAELLALLQACCRTPVKCPITF
jgi:hypothetical protein